MEVRRHTLPNGLRLVHSYVPTTAMVAVDVLYDVGSRDERRSLTGLAHLFEHLMFGGSVHVPHFDSVLESAGGISNAWTSDDFTNFYDVLPATNLDTALYLESDRMLGLAFSDRSLEVQRSVVTEEFKQQCLDQPFGDLMHRLRAMIYAPEHPYSWPTIGLEPGHIARVSMADVKDWFYSHYAPNNAVLAICGNVDFDTACRRAEHWFADVPTRQIAPRPDIAPGFPAADVTEWAPSPVPFPLIAMAFPMAAYGDKAYFAADTLTDILSMGRSSRFRTRLVCGTAQGLITDADASIVGNEGPGMLLLTARLAPGTDRQGIERARELLIDQCRLLAEPGNISRHELDRTLNNFEATHRFANIGYTARASNLAAAEMHGEDLERVIADRRTLTPDELALTAKHIFCHSHSATVVYEA